MKCKTFKLGLLFLLTAYFTINAWADTTDPAIELDKDLYQGLGDKMAITVKAPKYNINKGLINNVAVKVQTSESPEAQSIYLHETGSNTGIFKGFIRFNTDKTDIKNRSFKVISGTTFNVNFEGNTAEASWKPYDAEVKLNSAEYIGEGTCPTITVTDNDVNIDPNKVEELFVTVSSAADPKGFILRLEEKSKDSGIFTGSFGLSSKNTNEADKVIKVSYNENISVTYSDGLSSIGNNENVVAIAVWKPYTGTVAFNRSDYSGLLTTGTVSVTDHDLNIRTGYKDTARVRLTSGADPQGIIIIALETNVNTGVFAGKFRFSNSTSSSDNKKLKVNSTDTIMASYIDERNSNNIDNIVNTATAGFQFSEAAILTSAVNDEGAGYMLDITVNEPDANTPDIEDRIIAKVGTGESADDMTLYLTETGTNTGNFKCKLYLTDSKSHGSSLQMSGTDKINIKYTDNTTPEGNIKDIKKTIKWSYQSTILKLNRTAYTGYNSSATITLNSMELNEDKEKIDFAEVKVNTSSGSIKLKLKETNADSGEFSGTLYFGRSSRNSNGVIKVVSNDTVTISYTNRKDKNDKIECSSVWSPQDGTINLDRKDYKEDNAPVNITVKDSDIDVDPDEKDIVKVIARIQGNAKYTSVTLTETYNNSGVFTGILYINGSGRNKPSIALKPADRLEVVYTDEDTTTENDENRTAYATWGVISQAKLTLDATAYKGYGTYMTISLDYSDQNLSATDIENVNVQVKTKSGKTDMQYTLTETGSDTGIFTAQLLLTEEAPDFDRICVMAEDEITVSFIEKNVQISAVFSE